MAILDLLRPRNVEPGAPSLPIGLKYQQDSWVIRDGLTETCDQEPSLGNEDGRPALSNRIQALTDQDWGHDARST